MLTVTGAKQDAECVICRKDKAEVFVVKSATLNGGFCPKHLMALVRGMQNGKQEAGLFDKDKA